jgi:hypothetical protein
MLAVAWVPGLLNRDCGDRGRGMMRSSKPRSCPSSNTVFPQCAALVQCPPERQGGVQLYACDRNMTAYYLQLL